MPWGYHCGACKLFRLVNFVTADGSKGAWSFCVNHGIDDQTSINIFVTEMIAHINNPVKETSGNHGDPSQPPSVAAVGVFDVAATDRVEGAEVRDRGAYTFPFPPSIEQAVAPGPPGWRMFCWSLFQVHNSLRFPAMLPRKLVAQFRADPVAHAACADPDQRRTMSRFIRLTAAETDRLKTLVAAVNRESGAFGSDRLTITSLLSAAMLSVTNVLIQDLGPLSPVPGSKSGSSLNLRFLLSVGLRPFGKSPIPTAATEAAAPAALSGADFTGGTVACAAGAIDFIVPISAATTALSAEWVTPTHSAPGVGADTAGVDAGVGAAPRISEGFRAAFWELARTNKRLADCIITRWRLVPESVRLFGLGMRVVDILRAVEMDARNTASMGRGFSCGVSNMGVVSLAPPDRRELLKSTPAGSTGTGMRHSSHSRSSSNSPSSNSRLLNFLGGNLPTSDSLEASAQPRKEGRHETESLEMHHEVRCDEAYYATSHGRNGVLCLLSTMTVQGRLCGCLQFPSPIVSEEDADYVTDKLLFLLRHI